MSCDCSHASANSEKERKTLRIALGLNATMFVVGMAAGLWAQSSGLMADALDMLTDATAYGLGLMAVTRGMRFKQYSARWAGATLTVTRMKLWRRTPSIQVSGVRGCSADNAGDSRCSLACRRAGR